MDNVFSSRKYYLPFSRKYFVLFISAYPNAPRIIQILWNFIYHVANLQTDFEFISHFLILLELHRFIYLYSEST